MSLAEQVWRLEEERRRLDDLLGELLATLVVNIRRGTVTAQEVGRPVGESTKALEDMVDSFRSRRDMVKQGHEASVGR